MTGPDIVEPEQSGLGPLAVSELAKEFRRLAAEAKATNTGTADDCYAGQKAGEALTWNQAAQMLEERLNG